MGTIDIRESIREEIAELKRRPCKTCGQNVETRHVNRVNCDKCIKEKRK